MVFVKKGKMKVLSANDQTFNIDEFYKLVKNKIEDEGYDFVEKEQTIKEGKYGGEFKFVFYGVREWDEFAMSEIEIEAVFERINKVKSGKEKLDHGNSEIIFNSKTTLDYKNKWGKTPFSQFLFESVVIKYFNWSKYKKMYIERCNKNVLDIHKAVKELFDMYA